MVIDFGTVYLIIDVLQSCWVVDFVHLKFSLIF